ncbi:MAG: GNAT family N-acetyltransferase [Oscillospiraceae bacterium]|nr:GNAT family N-acetyltransferase [Oscillospiraceae bacterium]
MIIKKPIPEDISALRELWKEAFEDTDTFLDKFFSAGFSADRCRILTVKGQLAAALYWFDCSWNGKKVAYLYAVATKKAFQGQGLCRALITDTHNHLKQLGYRGAALVPANAGLFSLYGKFGYESFCPMTTHTIAPGKDKAALSSISWEDYEALRRPYLPENTLLQEGKTLAFLSTFARFYRGENCLLCGYEEKGSFSVCEYFGSEDRLPEIAAAFGTHITVRLPGGSNSAMYYPLDSSADLPAYLGLTLN